MSGTEFINTRELKNKTTELLRKVEADKTYVVTRRGKPIATLRKMFSTSTRAAIVS